MSNGKNVGQNHTKVHVISPGNIYMDNEQNSASNSVSSNVEVRDHYIQPPDFYVSKSSTTFKPVSKYQYHISKSYLVWFTWMTVKNFSNVDIRSTFKVTKSTPINNFQFSKPFEWKCQCWSKLHVYITDSFTVVRWMSSFRILHCICTQIESSKLFTCDFVS